MSFSKAQMKAINHNQGPMLVLAGPGSGKTTVITKRTQTLIKTYHIDPRKILVITFTKAATIEMKERFRKLMGNEGVKVQFGTFHAIFFTILKYAYHYTADNILKDNQKKQFLQEILQNFNLEIDDENDFLNSIETEISLVKGEMLSLDHYYSMSCPDEVFQKIYRAYNHKLSRANLIDFDDMLVYCYELLKEREDIRKIWQQQFIYILIDEFQDINRIQYEVIRMLALPENNLFIVGDDDQSIYRFRGAKPEIMLNFEKDYPNTKKVILDINYRSTGEIVTAAGQVIKNNTKRFAKNIKTIHQDGEQVQIKYFADIISENQYIVERVREFQERGVDLSEIAVLFRTNTQPRALIGKLIEYNIPFKVKDSVPNIYDHWITKNLITYIKIGMGNQERKLLLEIINKPNRYISRACLDTELIDFERLSMYYEDKKWMLERIDQLKYDLKVLKNMKPYAAITYIRKGIGYEEYLKEYAQKRRISFKELLDVLDEVQENTKEFQTFSEWFSYIELYKEELKKQVQEKQLEDTDSLFLATMHSAKGLEYKIVFIIEANEGITPYQKAVIQADLEEERRLFYVAMTRAKEKLYLCIVKERYNKQLEISRFVEEIQGKTLS